MGPAASARFGQYPPARRTIVHVSDTHLLAGNAPLGGRYDTEANLAETLRAVEALGIRPDAILFTGDLTDLGEPDAYRRLRAAVEPVAERLGAPLVWVAGNHDERPALREGMLDLPAHAAARHRRVGPRRAAADRARHAPCPGGITAISTTSSCGGCARS